MKKSPLTERLKSLGAKIYLGHTRENLGDAQAVVFSSAVAKTNPELKEAGRKKIPVIQRGEMLSEILRKGFSIAVSGAHGKTTTTAMIGKVVKSEKINPTVIIGGIVKGSSKNAILGKGKVFVAEADESDGTFQMVKPNICVVTNMDREHMDYYGDFKNMEGAYLNFMNGVPFDGLVTVCGDDPRLKRLAKKLKKRVIFYGLDKENDLVATDVRSLGFSEVFKVRFKGEILGEIKLPVPGIHNVKNALAACSVGMEMGLSFKQIVLGLEGFEGIERRMEVKGEVRGVTVVDDYAHHPTEIASTLKAARNVWDGRRFIVVFQPHRYSRIKDLIDLFPKAFSEADMVFVTDIYSAGEKPIKNINAVNLVELIRKDGLRADHVSDWRNNLKKVREELKSGDVLFSMGAGDITKFYDHLAGKICL